MGVWLPSLSKLASSGVFKSSKDQNKDLNTTTCILDPITNNDINKFNLNGLTAIMHVLYFLVMSIFYKHRNWYICSSEFLAGPTDARLETEKHTKEKMKKAERSLHWDTKNTSCSKPQAKVQGAERNFCKSSIALTRKAITAYAMPVCHRSVVDNEAERAGSLKEKNEQITFHSVSSNKGAERWMTPGENRRNYWERWKAKKRGGKGTSINITVKTQALTLTLTF